MSFWTGSVERHSVCRDGMDKSKHEGKWVAEKLEMLQAKQTYPYAKLGFGPVVKIFFTSLAWLGPMPFSQILNKTILDHICFPGY